MNINNKPQPYEYTPEQLLGPWYRLINSDRADVGIPLAPQNENPNVTDGSTPAVETGTKDYLYYVKRYDDANCQERMIGVPLKPMPATGEDGWNEYAGRAGLDRKISIVWKGKTDMIFATTGLTGSTYHATGMHTYTGMPFAPHISGFRPRTTTGEAYGGYVLEPGVITGEYAQVYLDPFGETIKETSGGIYL